MGLLEQSTTLERIELLAKFACVDNSSSRDRQVALIWIGEMVEGVRGDIVTEISKPPIKGGFESGGGSSLQ
jgi:hypothetical protein